MKIKFLIAGLSNLLLSAYQLITDYSRTGAFHINIWGCAFILIGIIFLIFSKKEENKFLGISVRLNLFGVLLFLIPILIGSNIMGVEALPFVFLGPISFLICILSGVFLVLGLIRYFENKKSTINNAGSNIVH